MTPKVKPDELGFQMMDKLNLTVTVLARLTETANDDIVILPIQINVANYLALRQGVQMFGNPA